MSIRILFLAAQLQPFLVSGIRSLLQNHDVEIVIYVQHPERIELFNMPSDKRLRIFFYNNEPESLFLNQVKSFRPQLVFCAGWMYPRYLFWCRFLNNSGAKTICAMDTQWKGNVMQRILTSIAPFTLLRCFKCAWVPGKRQLDYAQKLGFQEENILHNLYAPDTDLFRKAYLSFQQKGFQSFPKRFIYVGRLEKHKVLNLLIAFTGIERSKLQGWELHLYGDGSLSSSDLMRSPFVHCHKAVPQRELADMASEGGVFCLCSSDEPWGTVVQEFAAAGMPLVVSNQCGSSVHFLKGNGVLCNGADVGSIKNALLHIISSEDSRLFEMSENSHKLASMPNSDDWANELMSLV